MQKIISDQADYSIQQDAKLFNQHRMTTHKRHSTQSRFNEKIYTTLNYIFRNRFTTGEIIRKLNRIEARNFPEKMVQLGLLQKISNKNHTPKFFYILSRSGLNFLKERNPSQASNYERYKLLKFEGKVKTNLIMHDLEGQHIGLMYLNNFEQKFFSIDGRLLANLDKEDRLDYKIFDYIWIFDETPNRPKTKIGVEIERDKKHGSDLRSMFNKIAHSLSKKHVDKVIIFALTESIYKDYKEVVEGKVFRLSEQDSWSFDYEFDVRIVRYEGS